MSGQRRRLEVPILKIDTGAATTYQGVGGALNVTVLPTGAVVSAQATLNNGVKTTVTVDNPGAIRPSQILHSIDSSGTISTINLNVDSTGATWNGTNWDLEITQVSGGQVVLNQDDRLVYPSTETGLITVYTDDSSSRTWTNGSAIGSDGNFVGYVNEYEVDLYVSGSGVTSKYFVDIVTVGDTDILTPEHFGAYRDGTTDDKTALQKAIDYVGALKSGGTIKLQGGTYLIDGTLTMRDKVRLEGQGKQVTILKTSNSGITTLIDCTSSDNNSFYGIEFQDSSGGAVKAIDFNGEYGRFEELYFGATIGTAIEIGTGTSDGLRSIVSCDFEGPTKAVQVDSGTGTHIFDCNINSNVTIGATASGTTIENCKLGAGSSITDSGSGTQRIGNTGNSAVFDSVLGSSIDLNGNDVATLSYKRESVAAASAVTMASDTVHLVLTGTGWTGSTLNSISGCVRDRVIAVTFQASQTNLKIKHNASGSNNEFFLPRGADHYVNGNGTTLAFIGASTAGGTQWEMLSDSRGPLNFSQSATVGAINGNDETTVAVTATGAELGDYVEVSYGASLLDTVAGQKAAILYGYVDTADNVTVVFSNPTNGSITVANSTVYVHVYKRD